MSGIRIASISSCDSPRLHEHRCLTARNDRDRPILRIRDRKGNGVKAVTGEIILERKGQRSSIKVDDAWLATMGA